MYDLCADIEPDIHSSVYGSSDEGMKDKEILYYQEQDMVSAAHRNPRRLRWGEQITLKQLESKI